jgi:hypothetical protein
MVIDEEQYNRNPALYGKQPHQRAMPYEDYYRANYGTAEINTGSESELEYEPSTNQLGCLNPENLRSPHPDDRNDSSQQNQNIDTEPSFPSEGLPLGMNQRHNTEPNNRQLALANLDAQKDPDSDTPSEDYSNSDNQNSPGQNQQQDNQGNQGNHGNQGNQRNQGNPQPPNQGNPNRNNQGSNNQNFNRSNNQNWTNFFPGNLNNGNRIINVNINGVPQNTNFDLNGFLGQISGLLGNQNLGRCVQDSVNVAMQQVKFFLG